ncbi:Uncharacterised protein g2298 [Pycnogonum litorale]
MNSLLTRTKHALSFCVPSVVILGSVPQYFLMWLSWRTVSLILPPWIYQTGDDICFSLYQRLILFFFEHVNGIKVYLHGDAEKILHRKEKVIYISNHQCAVDWMVVEMLAIRQGSLGHVRYLMKHTLQTIPMYGHYFYQHGCIFVKRGDFNARKFTSAMAYLTHKRIPSWLVIFPEGTRFNPQNPDLLRKNRDIAIQQGYKPLSHVLFPRPKGMQMALQLIKDNVDAVYDVSIVYSNTYDKDRMKRLPAPSIKEFFNCSSPEVHIHLRRIGIEDIPSKDDAKFKKWLQDCFVEKDRLLSELFRQSDKELCESGTLSTLPLRHTMSSLLIFSVVSLPFMFTKFGRKLYFGVWLYGSLACYAWLGIRSVS